MNPLDTPPTDRSTRDRLEGMSVMQGILFGAALSVPGWLLIAGFLAAVHAVTTALAGS